jgi:hypothetical protein
MSPLTQFYRTLYIKITRNLKAYKGHWERMEEHMEIVFLGGPGGGGVKIVSHHITFMDIHDSWPIYLLYIWREIDLILIFIV